jgi:hypothetical protein
MLFHFELGEDVQHYNALQIDEIVHNVFEFYSLVDVVSKMVLRLQR